MTKEVDKKMMFLQEYKEGFAEIQKLVDGFDAIETASQETFIGERNTILKQQLNFLKGQRLEVYHEIRKFLASTNSKLKALSDTEVFLIKELEECEEFSNLLSSTEKNVSVAEKEKDGQNG